MESFRSLRAEFKGSYFLWAALALVLSYFLAETSSPLLPALPVMAVITYFLWKRPVSLLYLYPWAIVFSPEIPIVDLGARPVTVRVPDLLLVLQVVFFLRQLIFDRSQLTTKLPLKRPILVYAFLITLSTLLSFITGHASPVLAGFYLIKSIQYYVMFFSLVWYLDLTKPDLHRLLWNQALVLLALIGHVIIQNAGGIWRVTFPFDEGPNPLGITTVIWISLGGALFFSLRDRGKLYMGILLACLFWILILTLSRGAWVSLIVAFGLFILIRKKAHLLFAIPVVLSVFYFGDLFFPEKVMKRAESLNSLFTSKKEDKDIAWEERKYATRMIMGDYVPDDPFWGKGAATISLGWIDNEYVRHLASYGFFGLAALIFLLASLLYEMYAQRFRTTGLARDMAEGMFIATIALAVHCYTAEDFAVIRVMEPFWYLMALVYFAGSRAGTKEKET